MKEIVFKKISTEDSCIKCLSENEMIEFHKMLGDKIRYKIAKLILYNPGVTGKELLVDSNISQPDLSFHIAQLVDSKCVIVKRDGQSHRYYANYKHILSFLKSEAKVYGFFEDKVQGLYDEIKKICGLKKQVFKEGKEDK